MKPFAGYGGDTTPYLKQVDWKDFALKPVGTGPYKFVEWVKDDRIVLEANDAYWRGAPKIKKVIWRPIPDNFARVAALTRGEAQLITKVIPDHVAQVEKAGCCRVEHTLTNLNTVYLINAQKGPLANTKVRQALNYAVDKNKIIKELYNGYAVDRERHPEYRLRVQSGHQALPSRSRDGEEAPRRGRLRERPRDPSPERQRHPPERQAAHRGSGGDAGRGWSVTGKG